MIKKAFCLFLCIGILFFASPVCLAHAYSHVHTEDCYAGTKHEHEGTKYRKSGCYQGARIPGESHECGTYSYTGTYISGYTTDFRCSACGVLGPHDTDYEYIFKCDNCGHKSYHLITRCKNCKAGDIDREYTYTHWTYDSDTYELSCGKISGLHYNQAGEEVSHVCDKTVTSLSILKE